MLLGGSKSDILVVGQGMSTHSSHEGQGTAHNHNDGVCGRVRKPCLLESFLGGVQSQLRLQEERDQCVLEDGPVTISIIDAFKFGETYRNRTLGGKVVDSLLRTSKSGFSSAHGRKGGSLDARAKSVHVFCCIGWLLCFLCLKIVFCEKLLRLLRAENKPALFSF